MPDLINAVTELRERRDRLENEIADAVQHLVDQFIADTGMAPVHIALDMDDTSEIGSAFPGAVVKCAVQIDL